MTDSSFQTGESSPPLPPSPPTVCILDTTCCLCMDEIRIPVRIEVFIGRCACMEWHRVCLTCARAWAGIDPDPRVPLSGRTLRCLFCPTTVELTPDARIFAPDMYLIKQDARRLPCPYDGCAHSDTHQKLLEHIEICPRRPRRCPRCRVIFQGRLDTHAPACPAMRRCPACGVYVTAVNLESHLMRVHHSRVCGDCAQLVALPIPHECPERPVPCPVCQIAVRRSEWPPHRDAEYYHLTAMAHQIYQQLEALRLGWEAP